MAVTSDATARWSGTLHQGRGDVELASSQQGPFPVDWQARSEGSDTVTTPEELLGAAHAACYSMALAGALSRAGTPAQTLQATASVTFVPGTGITGSHLNVNAVVPGMSEPDFLTLAEQVKGSCPVSQALAGIEITLEASLG